LIRKIVDSVARITVGRKGLAISGEAEAGLISYYRGLNSAKEAFEEAAISADARAMILVEHAFLTEEKRFCDAADMAAIGSLTAATDSFDDALLALKAVGDRSLYQGAEYTFPHNGKYRIGKMPKDAFHIACIAHKTRLSNTIKTPGLNMTEKAIYQKRVENMGIAEKVYLDLQKKALPGL
jgi:hypothetical protein